MSQKLRVGPSPTERLAALEALDDAIIYLDRDLRVIAWNAAAATLHDYAGDICGSDYIDLISPDLQVAERDLLGRALGGESIPRHETIVLRRDGTSLSLSIAIGPIGGGQNKVTGVVLVGRAVIADERGPGVGNHRGNETILVVEDETAVRNIVSRSLRGRGYNVLEAKNGEDALLVAERHNAPIHLVVTDVVMPEMGGLELFEHLRRWYPTMRILFMSGYTKGGIPADVPAGDAGSGFLPKPFSLDQLAVEVRRIISMPRLRTPAKG